jgi:predicted Zn-dependent peptidase
VVVNKEILIERQESIGGLPKVKILWLSPKIYAEGDAAADILSTILSSGKSSRLHKKLVRELEIAQSVAAYQYSLGSQSVYVIDVVGRDGTEPKALLEAVDGVLAEVKAGKLEDKETTRAVNQFETGFFGSLQRLGGFGGKADTLQAYNHFLGDPGYIQKDLDRYRKVTTAEVTAFSNSFLSGSKRVVLFAVPVKKPLPDKPNPKARKGAGKKPSPKAKKGAGK